MIVDSSVIIAILRAEPGFEVFSSALNQTDSISMSTASYFETSIVVDGSRDPVLSRRLDELLQEIGIVLEPVTSEQARLARAAYRDYGKGSGHPARLNFGDCFAYALAKDKHLPLLFKGDDFVHTDVRPALAPSA